VKKRLFYVLAGSLLLAACGSSDSNDPPATGNLPATADVVTVGPVTGFGSIHSNGIHFGTHSATVMMDGESAILSDLKVGMIVSIHGTVNQVHGRCRRSDYGDEQSDQQI
jgi:hypothetical protein